MIQFKDIKYKLLFWYGLIVLFLLIIFSFILYQGVYQKHIELIDTKLNAVINDVDHDIESKINQYPNIFDEAQEFYIKHLYIKIERGSKVVSISNHFPTYSDDFQFVSRNSMKLEDVRITAATTIHDKIEHPLHTLLATLYILIPIAFSVTLIIGYALIYYSFKPVRSIINKVQNRNLYDLKQRIALTDSQDEIYQLIDTFNTMLDSIEVSYNKIKRFSNDASHELKTPLTVIRGEIELGLRKVRSIDEYQEILVNILEETKHLQELVDSLLFLSSHDQKRIQETFDQTSVDEIIMDILENKKIFIETKGIHISFKALEEVYLVGNGRLLKIAFANVLDNAIKYSHKNGRIELDLCQNYLSIKDYGIGIKSDEIGFVFDNFYRSDMARGRSGHGLGLSIVKQILELHQFKIELQSEYNEYTLVIIQFD